MKAFLPTIACGLCLATGVAHAQIAVRIGPPPPPPVERVPPPPPEHRDWAWHSGYYRWDGARYIWAPGVYEAPPRPRARWIAGRWYRRGGAWYWREGYWR